MVFYLGTHYVNWLWDRMFTGVDLFVSIRRLMNRIRKFPRAVAPYAIDSGGFSELNLYGRWTITPRQYCDAILRLRDELGPPKWCAAQDYMCETLVLGKTGMSVAEHQMMTVDNYHELVRMEPSIPFTPVVQGYRKDDYIRHVDEYRSMGVDLTRLPVVGVGSVCRRQNTQEAAEIVKSVSARGIRVHGFGFKIGGIQRCSNTLASSDSLAWSRQARYGKDRCGIRHAAKNCANCPYYALMWRERVMQCINA